jgi:hypothetical protein
LLLNQSMILTTTVLTILLTLLPTVTSN